MARFNTYVFLDLGSHEPGKVTEFSLLAVSRQHLLETPLDKITPRVQNKLSWCLNVNSQKPQPAKSIGSVELRNQTCCDKTCFHLINLFLNSIKSKPFCLVTYNAKRDYPILKSYLDSLDVKFSEAVMCADTHFMAILDKKKTAEEAEMKQNDDLSADNTLHMQSVNETTPRKRRNPVPFAMTPIKKLRLFDPESHTEEQSSPDDDGLVKLYEQLLYKEPPEGFNAEVRVNCMLAIAVELGKEFVNMIDSEALAFDSYGQNNDTVI